MAIVEMKKLRLMVVREQKNELLRSLQLLGCVQIDDGAELLRVEDYAPYLKEESSLSAEYRSDVAQLTAALKLLDKHAPVKSKLLSARPVVSEESFFDEESFEKELSAAKKLNELDAKLRGLGTEESRLRGLHAQLTPWRTFDLALETAGTLRTDVLLGMLPATADASETAKALADAAPESELIEISADEELRYVCLICLKEEKEAALEELHKAGFTLSSLAGMKGTAAQNIASLENAIEDCRKQKTETEEEICSYSDHRDAFKLSIDRTNVKLAKADAEARLVGTDSVLCMTGWMTAPNEKELEACLSKFDCAWEFETPDKEEYPEVPVKLKNNKFTEPLNMVTNMYSLPQYGSVDPNPLMAGFFILFYGIMMADMGYGLIMMTAALIVMKCMKPKGGMKYFTNLLFEGGVSTFVMGIFTGGFFGNAVPTLVEIFGGDPGALGILSDPFIDPLTDTTAVLVGAMALGFVHLMTGLVVNWKLKAKDGHFMDGVWDEGTWMVIFAGLALFVLDIGNIAGFPVLLIIGCLMLFYGSGREAKGIGKITAVFGAIYNGLTGWFGDILSYSRLMALMLAGSVIGQVFNTLAAMPSQGGVSVISILVFVIIFIIGHTLNFGLNLLGCFVHDLRLQCLEFFGKFYQDGGKPFKPLDVNTKYVDVENHVG